MNNCWKYRLTKVVKKEIEEPTLCIAAINVQFKVMSLKKKIITNIQVGPKRSIVITMARYGYLKDIKFQNKRFYNGLKVILITLALTG